MSWSSLPDDVAHDILAKLSLIELAGLTTTCSSFRAAFCENVARQQEARRQLAVSTFGAERIACLLDLATRLLKREPLPPGLIPGSNEVWMRFDQPLYGFWIRAVGDLWAPVSSASSDTFQIGDIWIFLCLNRGGNIRLKAYNGRGAIWEMAIPHDPSQHIRIEAFPINDEDLGPVALMQAFLSEGLTQIIRDVGRHAEVRIGRSPMGTGFTQAGLKAQIAPLLPFASQYTPVETTVGEPVKECMLIGKV